MPESAVDYGYFLFSVAPASVLSSCEATTVPLVVAATSSSEQSTELLDAFDMSIFLVPERSVRTGDSSLSSRHGKDFFKNPIALATDLNRFTGWKARGSFADFALTFNHRRFEYLNAYRVTCGQEASSRPTAWTVRGCVENWNGWSCDVVDRRERVRWVGAATTVEFAMNALEKSYQRFSIDFRCAVGGMLCVELTSGGDDGDEHNEYNEHDTYDTHDTHDTHNGREVWISEVGFLARATQPTRELQYPTNALSALVGQTDVYLQPQSPGFVEFTVEPELPRSLRLESLSGVVTGIVAEPGKETFTITAKQAVTMADASTTLTIASEGERCRLE